ncbi:PTS system mannose/fructose/N-acetylgalactosamine-transporter subunit IIB [Tepidimicrobium xylanilyticum]|uniref:PTS system, mannose-specific IIB component n=1 Tax=Tepidimicrobium xylanilyticum TaxID=1123352 RepID=A0A1H2RDT2_9FIRM|nr:PTS sugar transporter subunit IIB [Tepidimicrobium xylanilyticum]GMG95453.1 PTS mannose transporter subunit IID [Tepidimicrobium xylanilyticum]SDW17531.1 PTS system, mannose-specific IIB component [Tepidimicrobium xylanilyticum]
MVNIVLTRIDDRLIHGQVMTAWVKSTEGNRIIIVDDAVAQDQFLQRVLKMAAPPGIKVEVYDVGEGAEALKAEAKEGERVIILVKYPHTIEKLVDKGVKIEKLIVGGMGAGPGRKKFYRNISVSEEEKAIFSRLLDKGVEIDIRIVPDDKPIEISTLL